MQYADLSHYQDTVDLAAYKAAGHDRVALKATDGASIVDPLFAARWRQAGALGMARAAYHYAQTETGGAVQADHLLATVTAAGGLGLRDVLVLDVEDNDSSVARGRADEFAGEFCRRMVAVGHPSGLLYTGRWYADPCNVRPDDVPAGWRRLWLSDYSGATDAAMPLPAGWTRAQVVARQYTSSATVPGVTGRCDYSRTLNDWLENDDMPSIDEIRSAVRAELDRAARPGAGFHDAMVALGRAEGYARIAPATDPAALAAALAPHLPQVTAAQIADALSKVQITTTVESR